MNKLFLKINGVSRNDRFFVLLESEQNCRDEISERFADASAGFDHQMSIFLQRLGHGHRHLLLLRAKFEIFRLRKQSALGEDGPNPFDKFGSEGIFQRDH